MAKVIRTAPINQVISLLDVNLLNLAYEVRKIERDARRDYTLLSGS